QFAACGRGNEIAVYHVPSGRIIEHLHDLNLTNAGFAQAAHRDLVNSLAFNPDGTLLASAGYREVKLWQRPTQVQRLVALPAEPIEHFAVSPDQQWLAAATPDHRLLVYKLAATPGQAQLMHTLVGHSNRIEALQFSKDNLRLCSGALDRTLRVWDVREGKSLAALELPSPVRAVAWLADEKQLAAGGDDGLIHICSVNATNIALVRELKGHTGGVTALLPTSNGQDLYSGGADGIIRHWNVEDAEVSRELKQDAAVIALALRHDGKFLAAASTN